MIESLTILTGRGKSHAAEPVARVDFHMGDIVSVVGPTGSGKTTLINDLEVFANGNTPSRRQVLVNGLAPSASMRDDPAANPIALITQHTTFLSDMPVGDFLMTHLRVRRPDPARRADLLAQTMDFANQLTGEPIGLTSRMTELSGGQTRALLIADATVVCDTPIVLLDEVENAGIHRTRALDRLRQHRKIFIFVTHDPHIALLSDYRVVLQNGAITKVLHTSAAERELSKTVARLDDIFSGWRERLRLGEQLQPAEGGVFA